MPAQSEHTAPGHTLTGVLGGILVLAEIPIRLLEHYHLLDAVQTNVPTLYSLLISPTATGVRWVVGVVMIISLIVEYRRHRTNIRRVEPSAPPPPQQPIYFAPVIQNVQNVGPLDAARPAAPEPLAPPRQRGPNLIFLQARIAAVTFDHTPDRQLFYESLVQDRDDPRAVLACFRNEPAGGRAVAGAERVRAQVVYRNQAGREIGLGIARACWLDEFGDMVDFPVGEGHCAILITMRSDGQLLIPWRQRTRAQDGMGDVLNLRSHRVNEAISTIEIRLLDDDHGILATRAFDFASADGQLRIEPQPAPA
jgi:hypothetical protein